MFGFNAMLSRMKYITRWGLMHSTRPESLSEHAADTAVLAHTLCLVAAHITHAPVRSEKVCTAALYHDASEILTGDMPTPVKYKNEALRGAYKQVEAEAAQSLAEMLPADMREEMLQCLTAQQLTAHEKQILKAADRLSALIKCVEERMAGNREFAGAEQQQRAALLAMGCAEADYFMQNMLPCYEQTLDELTMNK